MAGSGGRGRTSPRLPSRLSSIDVSSPQMYAPAPSRTSSVKSLAAAADVRAEIATRVGGVDGRRERAMRVRIFHPQIDVALRRADGDAGNRHPFDEDEGVALHQHAVGERARVAFVRVAGDVFLAGRLVHHRLPLDAGRKRRAAAAAQAGVGHFLDDVGGAQRQRARQSLVAVVREVVVEAHRIGDADARERQPFLLGEIGNGFDGADVQRVLAAFQKVGVEEPADIGRRHRPVGHAARRGLDFDERLEPAHPARAVAHEADVDLPRRRLGGNRARDVFGAERQRGRVARDKITRPRTGVAAAITASPTATRCRRSDPASRGRRARRRPSWRANTRSCRGSTGSNENAPFAVVP